MLIGQGSGRNGRKYWFYPSGVIPGAALDLNFAAGIAYNHTADVREDISTYLDAYHTRASTAYMAGSDGVYDLFASGVLRQQDAVGSLLEGTSTNLFTDPFDLSTANWPGFRISKTVGDAAPLSGHNYTQAEATETNLGGSCVGLQSEVLGAATYTMSAHCKAGDTPGLLHLRPSDEADFTSRAQLWFDPATGALGAGNAVGTTFTFVESSVEELRAGEYRVSLTFSTSSPITASARLYVVDADGGIATTIGKNIQVWGAQLEAGSFASSITDAARAADSLIIPTADFGLSADEGAVFWKGSVLGYDPTRFGRILELDDGTAANRISYLLSQADGHPSIAVRSGDVAQASADLATEAVAAGDLTMAITWGGGSARMKIGSQAAVDDASVTSAASYTNLIVGNDFTGAQHTNALHKRLAIIKRRLSDAEFDATFAEIAG